MTRSRWTASLLLLLLGLAVASEEQHHTHRTTKTDKKIRKRALGKARSSKSTKKSAGRSAGYADDDEYYYVDEDTGLRSITLKITNLSFNQPLSPMFVVVHNADAVPLYTLGGPASVALSILAENGDPTPLAEAYANQEGVFFSGIYDEGAPWDGGGQIFITFPYRDTYPYITIAGKALNTNDGFVALNAVRIFPGLVINVPVYDAGSEINNENCTSIPGPACPADTGNVRSGDGEGFVHVHRGFFGIGDLPPYIYDWRNPLIRVEMMSPFG